MVTEITNASIQTAPQGSMATHSKSVEQLNEKLTASNVTELVTDNSEMVEENVSRLNDMVQSIQRDLQFSVDDTSGKTVVTVLDTKTNEVIRQIPTEQVLALSENIENLKGILFSAEV